MSTSNHWHGRIQADDFVLLKRFHNGETWIPRQVARAATSYAISPNRPNRCIAVFVLEEFKLGPTDDRLREITVDQIEDVIHIPRKK